MLLTIDIGNTNITMGVFEEEFLLGMFRMTTKRARTSDEYGFTICGILEHRGIDSKQIDSVIVASVVPDIMHSFTSGIIKYFGTATTYDLIGPECTLEACVIAPGIETAGRSLWDGAAMLPAIQIRRPESVLASETISGMQAGLVYGAIGQTEYIVKKMKEESGYKNAYVIATGGLGKIIADETECIDLYDPQLTLNGLRMIHEKVQKKR